MTTQSSGSADEEPPPAPATDSSISTAPSGLPPGWFPDPRGGGGSAYWDGTNWQFPPLPQPRFAQWPMPIPKRKSGAPWLAIPLVMIGGVVVVVVVFFVAVMIMVGSIFGSSHDTASPSSEVPTTIASYTNQPAAPPVDLNTWAQTTKPVTDDLSSTLSTTGQAFVDGRMADGRAGCKQLANDVTNLSGLLPSPDADLTRELQGVVDSYRKASAMCQRFDETTPSSVIEEARGYLNAGTDHMAAATEILKRKLG